MKIVLKLSFLAATAAAFTAAPAIADTLNITLDTPVVALAPGTTYVFDGTIAAPLTNVEVQILSDSLNADAPLVADDSDFLTYAPLNLSKGTSYTGALFAITLPRSVAAGSYAGIFDVIGNDSTVFGAARFTVNASAPTVVTPEPGSWLLLVTGCGVASLLRRRLVRSA